MAREYVSNIAYFGDPVTLLAVGVEARAHVPPKVLEELVKRLPDWLGELQRFVPR